MSTFRVPRTWSQLRAVGLLLRAFNANSADLRNAIIEEASAGADPDTQKLIADVEQWTKKFFRNIEDDTKPMEKVNHIELQRILKKQAKNLGATGFLALCDLSNRGILKDPSALVVLHIHSIVLNQPNDQFKIICTGTGLEDTDTGGFNSVENWPEIIPNGVSHITSDFSLQYQIQYVSNTGEQKSQVLTLKTVKIGGKLLINGLVGENDHFTVELKHAEYVSVGNTSEFAARYAECVSSLSPRNVGLAQFLPRAALTQLSELIQERLLTPAFNVVWPEAMRTNATVRDQNNRENSPRNPLAIEPPRSQDRRRPFPAAPVGPGFYGDSDLFPNFGNPLAPAGGNLFGPGHPNFGGVGPNPGRRPDGVPPGARFDPFSGVPQPGRPNPNTGGRPNPNAGGRGRGGDDLPPPPFNNDHDFGFYG